MPAHAATATRAGHLTRVTRACAVAVTMLAGLFGLLLIGNTGAAAQDGDDVRINLLHGIPGVAVDVISDDEPLVENFEFGDVKDISVLAGETLEDLQVRLTGTDSVAIDAGDTDLPSTGNFSIVAHLDMVGQPTLSVFANDTTEIEPGQGRLTVRHVAAAGPVDVLLDGTVVKPDLANGEEITADLDVDTYEVIVESDGDIVIGPDDVAVREGRSLIVYAVGSDNDQLRTFSDGYEVTDNAPVTPTPTPTTTASSGSSDSGSSSGSSSGSGSGSSSDSGVTTMTESVSGLGSAPGGVNTGITAVTVTQFSLPRTLLAVAIALLAVTGVVAGVRRRSTARA